MAEVVVEIHVPMVPVSGPHLWIDRIEEFLTELEEGGDVEVPDDGEEFGDVYVFLLGGAGEEELLAAASRAVSLPDVPAGAFAMVTDDEAPEWGLGRRVDLPLR
ncbi:hypothetical protein Aph02nite_89480 [Actinoplanes philippinensis]|uniref:YCII-related domain-containing protein n=1 Tax=Actinoplanes philippinensis TaxID=35752 RepID=A0A1I2M923_9ACTN|nr:hypothetical protein [Actinoplanes philippinensis]GIE82998.1 hypothetical protein Aph02nite_89480 [Actinoplanes philippinensis]SFF85721.1 hypothetical protein SAMN05421541_12613 [Actinoplanes philippinensis]